VIRVKVSSDVRWRGSRVKAFLGLVVAVHAISVVPAPAQQNSPGRKVSIGDRALWLACSGTGAPTVILEAGHTDSSATWAQVQPRIAEFTRVCSYDRAGRGRSDPAAGAARRGSDVVRDLHLLLQAAGESGPYILVGHSLGGAFVRLYASAYPGEVAGIVLIDAVSEREQPMIDEMLTSEQRALGASMIPPQPEGIDILTVNEELRAQTKPLAIPLVAVARGRPLAEEELPPTWTPAQRRRREAIREEAQAGLARLSSRGQLVIARTSGHFIHLEEPGLVVTTVRNLVDGWRQTRRRD
jgi:pimeloyl-ACP methyl ester carboxylesterase